MILFKNSVFFLHKFLFNDNVLGYTDKHYAAKVRGVRQILTGMTKGKGVGEMLTMADKIRKRRVGEMLTMAYVGEFWTSIFG